MNWTPGNLGGREKPRSRAQYTMLGHLVGLASFGQPEMNIQTASEAAGPETRRTGRGGGHVRGLLANR